MRGVHVRGVHERIGVRISLAKPDPARLGLASPDYVRMFVQVQAFICTSTLSGNAPHAHAHSK